MRRLRANNSELPLADKEVLLSAQVVSPAAANTKRSPDFPLIAHTSNRYTLCLQNGTIKLVYVNTKHYSN